MYYIRRVGGKKPSKRIPRYVLAMTRVERGRKEVFNCLYPLQHPLSFDRLCPLLLFSIRNSTTTLVRATRNYHQAPSTRSSSTLSAEKRTTDYYSSCVVQRAWTLPPSGRKCRLPRGGHLCEVLPAAAVAAVAAAIAAVAAPAVVVAP